MRIRLLFIVLGMILVTAALLKFSMLITDPFADFRIGMPFAVAWILVIFEFSLGMWSLSFRHPGYLSSTLLLTFFAFSIVATARLISGVKNCGCAGVLELPTWLFLTIDLLAVSSIVFCAKAYVHQGVVESARNYAKMSPARRGQLAGGLVASIAFLVVLFPIGAPLQVLLFGVDPITAQSSMQLPLKKGVSTFATVKLKNNSMWPAKVIGEKKSCKCVSILKAIEVIEPNSETTIELAVTASKIGRFRQKITYYIDHPKQYQVNAVVDAMVAENQD